MKKHSLMLFLTVILLPLGLASCSESDDTVEEFPDWQERNEAYFSSVYEQARTNADGTWKVIRNYSLEDSIPADYYDYIAVEVLNEGTGSGCPMFTDSVRVNYRGRLIPSTSYIDGYVFDESYEGEYNPATAKPITMYVGSNVDGFTTALQHMHIGDRWRVYIPYQLGYGVSGSGVIPGYSTLIFDIELIEYYRAGTSPTPWNVPARRWITE